MGGATALRAPLRGPPADRASATRREGRIRLVGGALALLAGLAGLVGLAWDVQWHADVGRDQFFTPPHDLIYGAVALRGLVALAVVLVDTWRYRQRDPAVGDHSTVAVLGWFHGPLGFVLIGFGTLATLVAAPLDNYWHELYGIDVSIWAPFHVMGILGGIIAGLGVVYALAAEARRRDRAPLRTLPGWLTLVALADLLAGTLALAEPAAIGDPLLGVGSLQIATYPLFLATFPPLVYVAAISFAGWPGAATVVAAVFSGLRLALLGFVPWGVVTVAQAQGLPFRHGPPTLIVLPLIYPHLTLVAAILVDAVALGVRRRSSRRTLVLGAVGSPAGGWWAAALAGAGSAVVGAALDQANPRLAPFAGELAQGVRSGLLHQGVLSEPVYAAAFLLALPFVLGLGAGAGVIGRGLGLILRSSER